MTSLAPESDKLNKSTVRFFLIFEIAGLILYPIALLIGYMLLIRIIGRYSAICALLDMPKWFVALALLCFASTANVRYNFRKRWKQIKEDVRLLKNADNSPVSSAHEPDSFLPPRP